MAFCIMRMAKIKDHRGVTMALQHNTRERFPENADPNLTKKNQTYGGSTAESLCRFEEILPGKIRKNAVLAVELVMTASPDFGSSPAHGNMGDYLTACDNWALKTFGIDLNKKDIRPAIHVAHHYDEKTPHTHILIVPMKDGKLNASHFIGGSRQRMAELQEDFYQTVGKRFGLDRGRSRKETRARHTHHRLADLDDREKKISEAENLIKKAIKVTPSEIQSLRTYKANWEKTTPAGLRVIAGDIERSGAATVGEYSQQREAVRKQDQQQGYKTSR